MQDKTINNALPTQRKQIIRDDGENLVQVEALLRERCGNAGVMPARRPDRSRRGQMRWIIYDALSDGPKTLPELAVLVAERRPDAASERAYKRASVVLAKMEGRGVGQVGGASAAVVQQQGRVKRAPRRQDHEGPLRRWKRASPSGAAEARSGQHAANCSSVQNVGSVPSSTFAFVSADAHAVPKYIPNLRSSRSRNPNFDTKN